MSGSSARPTLLHVKGVGIGACVAPTGRASVPAIWAETPAWFEGAAKAHREGGCRGARASWRNGSGGTVPYAELVLELDRPANPLAVRFYLPYSIADLTSICSAGAVCVTPVDPATDPEGAVNEGVIWHVPLEPLRRVLGRVLAARSAA